MSKDNFAAESAVYRRSSRIPPENILIDNHGRRINYVRLSVTDRCNLRCIYCMPEKMRFLPRKEILSYEEMTRLMQILAGMGINKVRLTGGEPFVRKDMMDFLWELRSISGIEKIHLTSNGVLTGQYVPELKKLDIASINLSLDSLDKERFFKITRRDDFEKVMQCFHKIIDHDIPLKVNAVLMEEHNTDDIIPMTNLTKEYPVDVRFIEEMPFNGTDGGKPKLRWNFKRIYEQLQSEYPGIYKLDDEPASTSMNYGIPGHRGTVGIIAGFSRTFCGSCNRIRITAKGMLQTCLYGEGVLDVKQLLRSDASDEDIATEIRCAVGKRFKDGWEAEKARKKITEISESMSLIGG